MKKHLVLAATAAVALLAITAPGLASAEVAPTGVTQTISMELVKGQLKFVAPASIHQGDELEVVNDTDPKKVGPHTFSLITQSVVPKTKGLRKNCFTPKHICMSIAKWHGFNPKTEKITINPVEVGEAGWSTPGDNSKKGDSWFTGEKKAGTSLTQRVTAEPGTIYFLCAIHPFMYGKTTVLPAGS